MIMAGHEILKFVCYPISKQADSAGKFRINWVAERHMPPTYQWRREDYNRTAKLEEFLPWFKDWKFDWLDVPGLIENCPHAYEYPLVDRDPVAQWTFGRVTLMGDAAHPMYPIGSNGASQAILDARVITREILAKGATNAALVAYEAERRPATTDLVMLNRRNGPEQVMQMVEERAPDGYDVVTDVLSLQELEDIAANYKRVAGFQVEGPQRQAADRPAHAGSAAGYAASRSDDGLRRLDQPRAGRGGRQQRAILGRQPPLHEGNGLAELGDFGLARDRPGLGGAEKIHRHGDGRRVEFSVRHGEHRRPHGVVEHRRENAALHEAGRVAEIPLAVEADPDPALLRPRVEHVPAEQPGRRRRGDIVESGADHGNLREASIYRGPAASVVSASCARCPPRHRLPILTASRL